MITQNCPCSSGLPYNNCCEIYHQHTSFPDLPEALMRSRFSAYALHLVDYLFETTHPSVRHLHDKSEIKKWPTTNIWLRLEICEAQDDIVEFKAFFEHNKQVSIHHERSTFVKDGGRWCYLSGTYFN